jgi:hypothetical protein
MIDYVKISILAGLCTIIFGSGYWMGYSRYLEYKKAVEIVAKEQEAKVESIQKQHELVKKGIQDEYDAKLNLLRNYYANGVRQPSSSNLPSISNPTGIPDALAPYTILAGQCAETTLMLTELQKWVTETYAIK